MDAPSNDPVLLRELAGQEVAKGASATHAAGAGATGRAAAGSRKRGLAAAAPQGAQVQLVEDSQGLLHWEYLPAGPTPAGASGRPSLRSYRRRGYAGPLDFAGRVVASAQVAAVGPNQVTAALDKLDRVLTPQRGLRHLGADGLGRPVDPGDFAKAKRLLLLVHGTFSKGDMYEQELLATGDGARFLQDAAQDYGHVATFDHPTLSVSPFINAMDLERSLQLAGLPPDTPIDVICHSRGGLVASWWMRNTRYRAGTVIAVGASLGGTSLASPFRVRYFLDYLANYAGELSRGLGAVAAVPTFASGFLAGASGLMGILGGFTSALSAFPVADAAIALVPGLHGQARITNNLELERLWGRERELWQLTVARHGAHCRTIGSNFEPASASDPWWHLWAKLRKLPWLAADGVADKVFPGHNDLVVDTECMPFDTSPPDLVFAATESVHHCNYFVQPRTIASLRTWLQL